MIDDNFSGSYECKSNKKTTSWESELIGKKLKSELGSGMLSIVEDVPTCVHSLFVVPKDGGGGRLVIDCSKPKGQLVNSSTDTVAPSFKYKSVDHGVEKLEQGGFHGVHRHEGRV